MKKTRFPLGTILLAFSGLAGGCEAPSGQDQALEPVVQDSAGVRIVHLAGEVGAYARPALALRELTRIGESGSGLDLFRVSGARLLPSGGLAIANAGVPEVLIVDEGGGVLAHLGRDGEGPGEFRTITTLHVQADSSILTYDDRLSRLTAWTPSGEVVDTRQLTTPNPIQDLIPLVASFDGPVLAVLGDNRMFWPDGIRQDSTAFFRFTPASTVGDTLSVWATKLWSFISTSGAAGRTQVPFSPDFLYAGRGGRAALANTHDPEVSLFGDDGSLAVLVRFDGMAREVTDADLQAWQQELLPRYLEYMDEGAARERLDIPPHPTHPVLEGIFVDAEGGVWLAPSSLRSGNRQTWILLDAQGSPRGSLELPASATLLDASGDKLVVLDRDELDVEIITLYRIVDGNAEG